MSPLDRFLLAFRRDLMSASPHGLDRYARLYWDDRAAFYQAQDAAWATGRAEPYLGLTQARALNEELSVKIARRFAHRLLGMGRFQDAANLLRDRRYRLMQEASALLELARAELGLGRLAEAAFVTARALELDPGAAADASELDHALTGLQAAQDRAAASRAWPDAMALCDLWMQAGSLDGAMRTLTAFLIGGAPLGKGDLGDFHQALDTVLSLCRPASACNLFRALAQQPIYQGYADALEALCAALDSPMAGPMPDAAAMGPAIGASAALALGQIGRAPEAITILGALSLAYHKAHYFRPPLARLVGQEVLKAHPLRYGPAGGGRKIFDVLVFNNEIRLLKMKLEEMAPWVDTFVLVEARQTFTGAPKPLVFRENRDQFAAFADKIVHVVVEDFPPHVQHPWAREFHQRSLGVRGLDGRVREDDLVIISDADEVISRDVIEGFEGEYAVVGMERMRYFLNYRQVLPPKALKEYASVWRASYLRTLGLAYARDTVRFDKKAPRLSPGGWHFTSISDAAGIAAKLNNSSHQEHAGGDADDVLLTLNRLHAGEFEPGWERWEIDERFPAYVRDHLQDFEDVIL